MIPLSTPNDSKFLPYAGGGQEKPEYVEILESFGPHSQCAAHIL
jgi:hypothetical protein